MTFVSALGSRVLSRSTSLTTCTNQLSLDDDDDTQKTVPQSGADNPLDLSARPTDLSSVACDNQAGNHGNSQNLTKDDDPLLELLGGAATQKAGNSLPLTRSDVETAKAVNDLLCSLNTDSASAGDSNVQSDKGNNHSHHQQLVAPVHGAAPVDGASAVGNDVTYNNPSSTQSGSYPQNTVINNSGETFQKIDTSNISSASRNSAAVNNVTSDKVSDINLQSFNPNIGTSVTSVPSNVPSDPFAASIIMLSSLQQMSPKFPSNSNDSLQYLSSLSTPPQLTASNQPQDLQSSNANLTSGTDNSLLSQRAPVVQDVAVLQQTPGAIKRSLSTSDRMYYSTSASRGLPYGRSLSTSGLSLKASNNQTINQSAHSSNDSTLSSSVTYQSPVITHTNSADSRRSPSPTNSYNLPPKKQRRCYSNTSREIVCTKCQINISNKKRSRCPNGHSSCMPCLEDRVKQVLTGKAQVGLCFTLV